MIAGAQGIIEADGELWDEIEHGGGIGCHPGAEIGIGEKLGRGHAAEIGQPVAELHGDLAHEADLTGASLKEATAREAVFYRATLRGTVFRGAVLSGADFREADLEGGRFDGATLDGARFEGARNIPEDVRARLGAGGVV